MPKYGDDLLLLCRGLQANGAQIFWDTLYIKMNENISRKRLYENILDVSGARRHIRFRSLSCDHGENGGICITLTVYHRFHVRLSDFFILRRRRSYPDAGLVSTKSNSEISNLLRLMHDRLILLRSSTEFF